MLEPDRIVPTTCPFCGVGCNLDLHIKDGLKGCILTFYLNITRFDLLVVKIIQFNSLF